MKSPTSNAMRKHHIPQGEMNLSLKREVAWETWKSSTFNYPDIPISSSTLRYSSLFHVLPPPFVNLRMRFLLRGAATPRVMESLITFIKVLIKDQIHWLIQF
jgi:hypothetical protein